MSLLQLIPVEAHEELAELILPTWACPLIAASIFLILAVVIFLPARFCVSWVYPIPMI